MDSLMAEGRNKRRTRVREEERSQVHTHEFSGLRRQHVRVLY